MKKTILLVSLTLCLFAISCTSNQEEQIVTKQQSEQSALTNSITLSQDKDFNALIKSINTLKDHIAISNRKLSKEQRIQNSKRLNYFLVKGDNLNEEDLKEISALLGFPDVQSYIITIKENQRLGNELTKKYSFLKKQSSQENNKLFQEATNKSISFNDLSSKQLDPEACRNDLVAACMATAYGVYVVVITSNCPGAAVFGPWGVAACLAGASVAYAASIYTCGETYCPRG